MTTITKTENLSSREYLEYKLIAMGLFESQAKEIVALAIPEIDKGAMKYKIAWNSPASGYSEMFYSLWFQTVKIVALLWIDKNCPNAWFRPMFDEKQLEAMKKGEGFPPLEAMVDAPVGTPKPEQGVISDGYDWSTRRQRMCKSKKGNKKKFHTTFQYSKGRAVVNGVEKKSIIKSK